MSNPDNIIKTLLESLEDTLEWIDTVPQNTVLPVMPGFNRDDVDELIQKTKHYLKGVKNHG
jgi:hypothetical protein